MNKSKDSGMKTIHVLFGILLLVTMGLTGTRAGEPISDKELGLSKSAVFDTPSPEAFAYEEAPLGSGNTLPRAYPGAPPQIPHGIQGFTPITASNNTCVGCHNNPAMWDQKVKGAPTPMPKSHYIDMRNAPENVTKQLIGARYVCTQCHVPQAGVQPLVDNKF